jgi:hypothetical protein
MFLAATYGEFYYRKVLRNLKIICNSLLGWPSLLLELNNPAYGNPALKIQKSLHR